MSGYDGYDSGFSDDRLPEAERLRQRDESRKIVIALWPEQMHLIYKVSLLVASFVLVVFWSLAREGVPMRISVEIVTSVPAINPTTTKQKPRFKPKQNATPSLIIASQSRKEKERNDLTGYLIDSNHELRKKLAALGVIDSASASDVKKVLARTFAESLDFDCEAACPCVIIFLFSSSRYILSWIVQRNVL